MAFFVGSIILELDHFIYWYFLEPNNQESVIAKHLIKQKKIKKIIKMIGDTAKFHTSLIFHNIIFQLILIFISIFIFTSTNSLIAQSTIFFIGINLLIKQIYQLFQDKKLLQKCLFAKLDKQIPTNKIQYYVFLLIAIYVIFLIKLIFL